MIARKTNTCRNRNYSLESGSEVTPESVVVVLLTYQFVLVLSRVLAAATVVDLYSLASSFGLNETDQKS